VSLGSNSLKRSVQVISQRDDCVEELGAQAQSFPETILVARHL
jgi:hypothetical protein